MASVERLSLALHASIPPAIFSVLANSIVTNKTYAICKLAGDLVPEHFRQLLRRAYVVFNACFLVGVFGFLHWNCPGTIEDAQASCLPSYTLVAVVLLTLLWLDRGTLAFLNAPGATEPTFIARVARGASCLGFLMGTSEQDEIAQLFLVLALSNRYSGSVWMAKRLRHLDRILRVALAVAATQRLYASSSSRRNAVMCVFCVVHSR